MLNSIRLKKTDKQTKKNIRTENWEISDRKRNRDRSLLLNYCLYLCKMEERKNTFIFRLQGDGVVLQSTESFQMREDLRRNFCNTIFFQTSKPIETLFYKIPTKRRWSITVQSLFREYFLGLQSNLYLYNQLHH